MIFVRWVERKRSKVGHLARKGKFIRGKREGDWFLRRTRVLPFWRGPPHTPPMKNYLKGWSRNHRSGIWGSCTFEKIGASEKTACHLGNLVSLTDHCDFILCLWGWHNEPSYQGDPMWALSFQRFWLRIRAEGQSSVTASCGTGASCGWDKKRLKCGSRGFVWGQSFW